MPTQRKIDSVADLTDKLSRTQLALVTDYRGLTVAEIGDLRKKLRETGAELIVAKNTLTLRAAKESGYDALEPLLSGPTALAFAYVDAAKTAKAILASGVVASIFRGTPSICLRNSVPPA